MTRWFPRLVALLGLMGLLSATLPREVGAHCRPSGAAAHQSHHDHAKDTGDQGQCPHCPPADCRRHAECASGPDTAVSGGPPPAAAVAPEAPVGSATGFQSILRSAPPTPPPQSLS